MRSGGVPAVPRARRRAARPLPRGRLPRRAPARRPAAPGLTAGCAEQLTRSAVPDVLAPGLAVVFCGINPGRVSAAAAAHFANPRNDFWRLLHEAGFTPRQYEPTEQFELLGLGIGVTNAAERTTPGSGDLRRADFEGSEERLIGIVRELRPRTIAFVGKEAYRGAFGKRPEHGLQPHGLEDTSLFVLPSTSPANAAVPYAERLRRFRELHSWVHLEPVIRPAVRALVLRGDEVLLLRYVNPYSNVEFWATPGGGIDPGEDEEQALRRELREELGLDPAPIGPVIWRREHVFPWDARWMRQVERYHLVQVAPGELEDLDTGHLVGESVHEHRWWTLDELAATDATLAPFRLADLLRELRDTGPPPEPVDVY